LFAVSGTKKYVKTQAQAQNIANATNASTEPKLLYNKSRKIVETTKFASQFVVVDND